VQQQGLAGLAVDVAAPQQCRECALRGFVQAFAAGGELAAVEQANHDAGTALFLGVAAFYAVFHACSWCGSAIFVRILCVIVPSSRRRGRSGFSF
jgi:hypothetical protein